MVGPLIHRGGHEPMDGAVAQASSEGGKLVAGGAGSCRTKLDSFYARPAVVCIDEQTPVVQRETFAPLVQGVDFTVWGAMVGRDGVTMRGVIRCASLGA